MTTGHLIEKTLGEDRYYPGNHGRLMETPWEMMRSLASIGQVHFSLLKLHECRRGPHPRHRDPG